MAMTNNRSRRRKAPTNAIPPTLPPTVEIAYKRKCVELKRRMNEVEESNDAFRLRKVRLLRGIRKMRLERAILLENLSKRMKKNGVGGPNAVYDDDSEGSSEGPPTVSQMTLLRFEPSDSRTKPNLSSLKRLTNNHLTSPKKSPSEPSAATAAASRPHKYPCKHSHPHKATHTPTPQPTPSHRAQTSSAPNPKPTARPSQPILSNPSHPTCPLPPRSWATKRQQQAQVAPEAALCHHLILLRRHPWICMSRG